MQEMEETWVQFLIQENPLEDAMATHSTILAWRQRSLDRGYGPRSLTGYGSWGFKEPDMTEAKSMHVRQQYFFSSCLFGLVISIIYGMKEGFLLVT